MIPLRFLIHMNTPEETAALERMLRLWAGLTCANLETGPWEPGAAAPAVLFWDLDTQLSPPQLPDDSSALLVCSSSSQAAIDSYSLHPDGFLHKPIRQEDLHAALRRCIKVWWDALDRLEILSDRLRVRLPLCDLVWAEGARRGCLVHSSHECISNRESLSALEARLPGALFFRCQRSFLVNLTHVQKLDSQGFHMSDGAVVPLSRNSRAAAVQAYQRLRRLMEEGSAPEEEGNIHE